MRKMLLVTACLLFSLLLFTGCRGGDGGTVAPPETVADDADTPAEVPANDADADTPADEPAGDAVTITVWYMGANSENQDAEVIEAANARLRELGLNIEFNPIWTGGWGMGEPASNALNTGDSSIDIFWTGSWGFNYYAHARVGNFIRIDDPDNNLLERYGQDMYNIVDDVLWDVFRTNGPSGFGLYGVPGPKDTVAWMKLNVNRSRIEYLGFDFDEIFDMNDSNHEIFFEPIFAEIMQASIDAWGDDGFFPLNQNSHVATVFSQMEANDLTGANIFNWHIDPINPALPVEPLVDLRLEDERFLRTLDRIHYFWNRGFINPSIVVEPGDTLRAAEETGQFLFSVSQYPYGATAMRAATQLHDDLFAHVPLTRVPILSTVSAAGSGFGISVFSPNQAEAMQFLNAKFTDNILATIIAEGVEGIHWNPYVYVDADGVEHHMLDPIPDGAATYSTWRFGTGNAFVITPRVTDGPGFMERFHAFNMMGVPTATMGFMFDAGPVAVEMAAITAVVAEYHMPLIMGALDPAEAVPSFLASLKANGAEAIRDEVNRQLQEFYDARR